MSELTKNHKKEKEYSLPIDKLYPDLTSEQRQEVEYFLTQYLEIVHRIYEESQDLTSSDLNTTV